jgi:hypothetical protein
MEFAQGRVEADPPNGVISLRHVNECNIKRLLAL